MIYLGSDHGGFELKRFLSEYLTKKSISFTDLGPHEFDPGDDYVDYAKAVCESVSDSDLGVLICRSGQGMCIAANKYKHIRAVLGYDVNVTKITKSNDWANVLCMPADYLTDDKAIKVLEAFLDTPNTVVERHIRRIKKI